MMWTGYAACVYTTEQEVFSKMLILQIKSCSASDADNSNNKWGESYNSLAEA